MAKIQKGHLLSIANILAELAQGNSENVKFKYAIAKNNKIIEQEVTLLNELQKPGPEIEDFERKRQMVCMEHCEKDESGQPVIDNNMFKILPEEKEVFDGKMKDLYDANKEILEKAQAKQQEFYAILNEEVDIPFYQISIENVTENLSQQQVNVLLDYILVG